MFPDSQHAPAHFPQSQVDELVPRPVRRDLLPPERRIPPRLDEMPRAPVPETARLAVASCEGGPSTNTASLSFQNTKFDFGSSDCCRRNSRSRAMSGLRCATNLLNERVWRTPSLRPSLTQRTTIRRR
jgi:hypothetical protein